MDHPSRYALVELENVHDLGLDFAPIHRVLFGIKVNLVEKLNAAFKGKIKISAVKDAQEMKRLVSRSTAALQRIGFIDQPVIHVIELVRTPIESTGRKSAELPGCPA